MGERGEAEWARLFFSFYHPFISFRAFRVFLTAVLGWNRPTNRPTFTNTPYHIPYTLSTIFILPSLPSSPTHNNTNRTA